MLERELCQAQTHHPSLVGEPHFADTVDHFTPRCMIQDPLFHLDPALLDDPLNRIPMHRLCHNLKDLFTPAKYYQRRNQLMGRYIGLGEHY